MLDRRLMMIGLVALAACGRKREETPQFAGRTPQMDRLVAKYARLYDMPESLIHRVIQRESGYNPGARNGTYYGLMQIDPRTARTMGFRGEASDLLDAEANLKYAGKYLRGAWLVSRRNQDRAVSWYSRGYYYEAKRMGLLEETGLRG
ncbi:lytic transglycosylase domain-containing protein [Rhodobacter sp. KR11]|uniref:lytic transglycosylase domain-containing protein n=1 Tax=Rhodobacter sp. KR11 TaxID=2974588 RepID=UPI0039B6C462